MREKGNSMKQCHNSQITVIQWSSSFTDSLQISVYNVISFKHVIFVTVSHKYFSSKYLEKVVRQLTSPKSSSPEADLISDVCSIIFLDVKIEW